MSTLDTKLTAEEEKAVIDKVYETLSKDIKEVVDALKDEEKNNDQSAEQNIQQLSARLDQWFYNYCKEIFKDQEQITEIKKAINAALLKFPKNNDLIKLKSFVEWTKTYTDNTKTETFEWTGRNINRFNGTTEQQKELSENLNILNSNINTLPETNLKTLLNAMLTVAQSPRWEWTQALQYYIYNELPNNQKENFLVKNKKRWFTWTEIKPETFDWIKWYNTLTAFINISNAKIDKYNQDKQDIDNNNTVFNQLMGNSTENTRIINEALAKAKADKAKKEAEEEQKRKIEAWLQKQTDFIEGIKGINDIPEEWKQKVSTKLQSLQARYDEEINRTNRNETLLRSLQDLLKNPVLIYQRILIGEKIKERINTLQTNLQEQKIKPEDLTWTGFEIKNNLVVISSAFEKALKAENLWDEEEITENKSQQRESRETFEEKLLKNEKLQNISTEYQWYIASIKNFENSARKYANENCSVFVDGNNCTIKWKEWVFDESKITKAQIEENIQRSREQTNEGLQKKYEANLQTIQNLKSNGVVFNNDGTLSKIKNDANYEEIYNIIKTTVQDYEDQAEEVMNSSNLQNITEDSEEEEEDTTNPEVVEVTKDNFRSLRNEEKLPAKQIKKLVDYANKEKMTFLSLDITEIDITGAQELALYKWDLYLDNITNFKLTKDIAKELAQHQWVLTLDWLENLSIEAAQELVTHKWTISLLWLKNLNDNLLNQFLRDNDYLRLSSKNYAEKYSTDERMSKFNHKLYFKD